MKFGMIILGLLAWANLAVSEVGDPTFSQRVTVQVHREFQSQLIDLNSLVNDSTYKNYEVEGVEVVGRPYTSKTKLTLWINSKVENTEWMSKEDFTPLHAKSGKIIGKNIHALQIYISSMAFVDEVRVLLRK